MTQVVLRSFEVRKRSKKFPPTILSLFSWMTTSLEMPLMRMILAMTALQRSCLPVAKSHLGDSERRRKKGRKGMKAQAMSSCRWKALGRSHEMRGRVR